MKLAVIADIHGNASALRAVLADMDALGVSEAVMLGDHFSGPLDAKSTAEILMARGFPSVRGNHDRCLLEHDPKDMIPSDKTAYDQLNPAQLDWLATLPPTLTLHEEIFMCHGTPSNDNQYWLERCDPSGIVRPASRSEVEKEAEGIKASLLLCGHTHIPRIVRLKDGRVVLNPGSVGCPAYNDDEPVFHRMETGSPNASYAIVEKARGDWSATFRSVPYPVEDMVRCAQSHGCADWAAAVRTGWCED